MALIDQHEVSQAIPDFSMNLVFTTCISNNLVHDPAIEMRVIVRFSQLQ